MTEEPILRLLLACAEENEGTVASIATWMERSGRVAVWFAPWHSVPGEDRQQQMEEALIQAQACAIFVGDGSGGLQGWQNEQMRVSIQTRVEDRRPLRVIPVLLPSVAGVKARDLPPFLRRYEPIYFRDLDDGNALRRLLAGALGVAPASLDTFASQATAGSPRTAHALSSPPAEALRVELLLHHTTRSRYKAELYLYPIGSTARVDLLPPRRPTIALDPQNLLPESLDHMAYGKALGHLLFGRSALREGFARAQATAAVTQAPIRFQLQLDPNSPALHALHWELLRLPNGSFISMGERLFFARSLGSEELTPVRPSSFGDLRALVVVANPDGLDMFGMAPLDAIAEARRAEEALTPIRTRLLARASNLQPVTIEAITAALQDRPDILYLVCHGSLYDGVSYLWLEDQQGAIARVDGASFAERIKTLALYPGLVVLASCASAGARGGDSALTSLGTCLVRAGIPAVLAMSGSVSIDLMTTLIPAFFSALRRSGYVDQALAVARLAAFSHPDWWRPVLYTRLQNGLLFRPG